MKATVLSIALAALALGPCAWAASVSGPAIAPVDGRYELVLPPQVSDAIQKAVPGFQPEALASY
jgi:hypothetical protein